MAAVFPLNERRLLLSTRGIGETVVHRLEAAGFASLQALCEAGAARVTEQVLAQVGGQAWRNRRRAIERAIADAVRGAGAPAHGAGAAAAQAGAGREGDAHGARC